MYTRRQLIKRTARGLAGFYVLCTPVLRGIRRVWAEAKSGVNHVTIRGPIKPYGKTFRWSIEDILSDKVFLAYQVNGEKLPRRHGFPLRLVAEDYYGADWVKYVHEVTVEKT